MSGGLTFPGFFGEEVPGGVPTITGVATSIAAFVGFAKRGPVDEPTLVWSFGDFGRFRRTHSAVFGLRGHLADHCGHLVGDFGSAINLARLVNRVGGLATFKNASVWRPTNPPRNDHLDKVAVVYNDITYRAENLTQLLPPIPYHLPFDRSSLFGLSSCSAEPIGPTDHR